MPNIKSEIIDESEYIVISGSRDHDSDSEDVELALTFDRSTLGKGSLLRNFSNNHGYRTLERKSSKDLNTPDLNYVEIDQDPNFQSIFSVSLILIMIIVISAFKKYHITCTNIY